MLNHWPIRTKLLLGLALLVVIVTTLAGSGLFGFYTFRSIVRTLSSRANELPPAMDLIRNVSHLGSCLHDARPCSEFGELSWHSDLISADVVRSDFTKRLEEVRQTVAEYRAHLEYNDADADSKLGVSDRERDAIRQIEAALGRMESISENERWVTDNSKIDQLEREAVKLQSLAGALPVYLYQDLRDLRDGVRTQYRTLIVLTWCASVLAVVLFGVFVRLCYVWLFRPLRILITGSRKVAAGQFNYRIHLDTQDEMSELAEAMNAMTARFQDIRDDLDHQVQERTKQVVRSEQLASVGFLAAGVAHEINNPLASIAMCSESLEGRLAGLLPEDHADFAVVKNYLRMIQSEAFRCKEITEKLLDFSRLGDVQHANTDLRDLVEGVIEMISHLGRYQDKQLVLLPGEPVIAAVNAQEMKQVVLNLLTNGLDSLDAGGTVTVELHRGDGFAELNVRDDGCGMTEEVRRHLFEPFFTRRRGGQGTGLGLSITYRIIADHDGHIEAESAGPGQGSRFRVTLPLAEQHKEYSHRHQAA